ncbi:MAG: glutathione S-transferase family protein [Geminicoccaceae bacterium]
MRLYSVPVSNYCSKIRLIMAAKSLSFDELMPPDGYGSEAYKAVIPSGTIPGLIDGDVVLSESTVIAEYLEEAYRIPPLMPADVKDRAHVRLVNSFHDSRLEPVIRGLFGQIDPAKRIQAQVEGGAALWQSRLEDLERIVEPKPFIAGTSLSLADCAYPATLLLAERMFAALRVNAPLPRRLADWWAHIGTIETVESELRLYGEAVDAWITRKLNESEAKDPTDEPRG